MSTETISRGITYALYLVIGALALSLLFDVSMAAGVFFSMCGGALVFAVRIAREASDFDNNDPGPPGLL